MVGVPKSVGCAACRRRKKGCDSQRPCSRCIRAGLHCDGYERPLIFKYHNWGVNGSEAVSSERAAAHGPSSIVVKSKRTEQEDLYSSRAKQGSQNPKPSEQPTIRNGQQLVPQRTPIKLTDAFSRKLYPIHKPIDLCNISLASYHTKNPQIRAQSLNLLQYFIITAPFPCSFLSPPHYFYKPNIASVPGEDAFWDHVVELDAQEMLRGCASNELRLAAALAAVACRVEQMEGISVVGGSAYFVQSALVLLRNDLNRKTRINENHLFTIYYLCTADAYRGNLDGVSTHLNAAKKLMDDPKSFSDPISPCMRNLFARHDAFLVQRAGTSPGLPSQREPESAANCLDKTFWTSHTHSSLNDLGKDFFLCSEDVFNREMRDITDDLVEVIIVMENITHRRTVPSKVVRWVLLRLESIRHRLVRAKINDKRGAALRVTMLLWIMLVQDPKSKAGSHRLVKPFLKKILYELDMISAWKSYSRLYIWVLTISASSELESNDKWFAVRLADTIKSIGYDTIDLASLRAFSERFLYFHPMQRERMHALCNILGPEFEKKS